MVFNDGSSSDDESTSEEDKPFAAAAAASIACILFRLPVAEAALDCASWIKFQTRLRLPKLCPDRTDTRSASLRLRSTYGRDYKVTYLYWRNCLLTF